PNPPRKPGASPKPIRWWPKARARWNCANGIRCSSRSPERTVENVGRGSAAGGTRPGKNTKGGVVSCGAALRFLLPGESAGPDVPSPKQPVHPRLVRPELQPVDGFPFVGIGVVGDHEPAARMAQMPGQ